MITFVDPKTGKEVNTADSPLPKSSSISPSVNANPITVTTPISSSTAPTQPITSTPPSSQSSQSTNNVGVQPLASNTNQSGMNAPTLQKPITTTGPGGILPELGISSFVFLPLSQGSMNVSQSKDKGASTTSASTISSSSASTATTSSDKQPSNSTTITVSVTPVTANSSTQETTPIIEAKPEKKKKMKEILKKAEEGTYKAASFDAYTYDLFSILFLNEIVLVKTKKQKIKNQLQRFLLKSPTILQNQLNHKNKNLKKTIGRLKMRKS